MVCLCDLSESNMMMPYLMVQPFELYESNKIMPYLMVILHMELYGMVPVELYVMVHLAGFYMSNVLVPYLMVNKADLYETDMMMPYLMVQLSMFYESYICLLYTSPSPRDRTRSRMPSSA